MTKLGRKKCLTLSSAHAFTYLLQIFHHLLGEHPLLPPIFSSVGRNVRKLVKNDNETLVAIFLLSSKLWLSQANNCDG